MILGIFVYLFISKVAATKVKFRFYKQSSQGATRTLFANEPFLRKMLVLFFSSNIPQYIEKKLRGRIM